MVTSKQIKAKAYELGITLIGIVPAEALTEESEKLQEWLRAGFHGKMGYMERTADKRSDPRKVLPSARSVISTAINYYTPYQHEQSKDFGKISRYAWGKDYHEVLANKLRQLLEWIKETEPQAEGFISVDAGPMMDKAWAVRAGLGWLGKHTNVISRSHGSWLFLGEIVTNLELEYDTQIETDHCGKCMKCIEACPTSAIVAPYVLDARKCISYATIELKDDLLPTEITAALNGWIFGCDICQDVCPWNRFSKPTDEPDFAPRSELLAPVLEDFEKQLCSLSQQEFKHKYRDSPLSRPKLKGLLRNVRAAKFNLQPQLPAPDASSQAT
ncbi:MAG: tRNA epoxyqueuosine(34) reductase QueG [Acidobacteriota bacterium]|nr:tRNA epoxyqueuosine(34) reductase QueG [Blastocatellia bacterium]MDW8411567.1 tRNA epoxyqueuosine(34) reductase QueG [Acidobacteriota bacterium]